MKMCNCNQGRLPCTCKTVERASVPRELTEQRQGETVTLPARLPVRLPEGRNLPKGYAEAWNACIDEIAKLGPLYTHPAPAVQKGEPVACVEIGADRNACVTVTDNDWLRKLKDKAEHLAVHLYTHPDPGEVERLRTEIRSLRQHKTDYMEAAEETRKALLAQLAERDALLRDWIIACEKGTVRAGRSGLPERTVKALAARAEPMEERGSNHGFEQSPNSCRHDKRAGVWWREGSVTRTGQECCACGNVKEDPAASAEPSAPVERDGLDGVEDVAALICARIQARAALERKP